MLLCSRSVISITAFTLHAGQYGRTSPRRSTLGALKPATLTFIARVGNSSSSEGICRSLAGRQDFEEEKKPHLCLQYITATRAYLDNLNLEMSFPQ